ncbi:hypothetical protein [Saccharothrix coeruleofusca]|uniref:Uncharacterized protein n=1 Tax=Saccharothrix coeruleofusca TaxID=33919 RepID=A0A918ATI5_9PSEU|nr:hypothetical protein GCM10010185_54640 [Saccharothrix coeruleofusca]
MPLAAAIWVYDLLTGIAGARPGTEPSRMKPLVLVDVGLTPRLLGHMPNLTALARKGRQSNLSDLGEIHL